MDLKALVQQYDGFYAPSFVVKVGTRSFSESSGLISDLSIDATLDGADRFSFTLNYPFDHADGAFDGFVSEEFEGSALVSIALGYGNTLTPLLVGRITSMTPNFPAGGAPTIEVSGYDLTHDMMGSTRKQTWEERTDSDVARELAEDYGFNLDVEETGIPHREIIQDNKSDYEFMRERAKRYNMELFVRSPEKLNGGAKSTLVFRDPPDEVILKPTLSLAYGESLRSFSPELNQTDLIGTVTVTHWDPKRKEKIVGRAERPSGSDEVKELKTPVDSRDDADRVAKGELDRAWQGLVRASGETVGLPEIRVGTTLKLSGVDQFTGLYYVERVTHRLGGSGYTTSFNSRRALAEVAG
ncbi:phage late control D family protein [Halalkalicoccus salilacus]|uniref:phage late control D family protein n=1 Tax=Halalkalicoccus salilacus TaxID=3117459 RepID=UPI00300F17EB